MFTQEQQQQIESFLNNIQTFEELLLEMHLSFQATPAEEQKQDTIGNTISFLSCCRDQCIALIHYKVGIYKENLAKTNNPNEQDALNKALAESATEAENIKRNYDRLIQQYQQIYKKAEQQQVIELFSNRIQAFEASLTQMHNTFESDSSKQQNLAEIGAMINLIVSTYNEYVGLTHYKAEIYRENLANTSDPAEKNALNRELMQLAKDAANINREYGVFFQNYKQMENNAHRTQASMMPMSTPESSDHGPRVRSLPASPVRVKEPLRSSSTSPNRIRMV